MQETFKQQLRKKIIEMKSDAPGFYTETYNLVAVMIRLTDDSPDVIRERMSMLYRQPSEKYKMSLSLLEELYDNYKKEPNLRVKGRMKINKNDVKVILDKVRRDVLFYLAVVEDKPKDYNIVLQEKNRNGLL